MFPIAILLLGLQAVPAAPPAATPEVAPSSIAASAPLDGARDADPAVTVPGREMDAQVARIAWRLAAAGRSRCSAVPASGLVFQHLLQFHPADRAGVIAVRPLDRGPGVIVVVPDAPGAAAGIRAGDVLLAVDGVPLAPEPASGPDLAAPFDAARARARADAVDDLLERAEPVSVTLLRDAPGDALAGGTPIVARIDPRPVCPSRVRLARSEQRNAYADGRHVFMTTGLLARLHGDDELAFVLAHEMAHNILGHAALMRAGGVRRGITRGLGRSGQVVRAAERAADALAGDMMLDAGFDPVAGAAVLARLGGDGFGLFADHDPATARVAVMRTLAEARRVARAP